MVEDSTLVGLGTLVLAQHLTRVTVCPGTVVTVLGLWGVLASGWVGWRWLWPHCGRGRQWG